MSEVGEIKALIVDDEPLARRRIKMLLASHPEVSVIGESTNGREALSAIDNFAPDLIFLDMQMPEMDGLSFIKSQSSERLPLIIFVTAYDTYGLAAFEAHAIDYLLKPYDQQRFDKALRHAKARLKTEEETTQGAQLAALINRLEGESKYLKQLSIRIDGRILLIEVENIDWIEAERNYVRLHVARESFMRREPIGSLETQLDPARFRRIHRSAIVNMDAIRELHSASGGDYKILLRNEKTLTLSHTYQGNLPEFSS